MVQRKPPHATERDTTIICNKLRARSVCSNASHSNIVREHEEISSSKPQNQCVRLRQECGTVDILKVKPANRELLASPLRG